MRPKDVWEKTHSQRGPHEKRKRASRARKPAGDGHAASDASNGTALHSDASSPPNEAAQEDGVEESTDLPPAKRQRASSVQVDPAKMKPNNMSDSTAALALQRAIQSSPARFIGSQHTPIEINDLTPKPTRRLLFPSPTRSEEGRALKDHDSNPANKTQTRPQGPSKTPGLECDQADKENHPPIDEEEDLNHLFEENEQHTSRPTTPTTESKIRTPSFKTPPKSISPNRTPRTSDFFSSAARALLGPITTPKRTPTKAGSQPLVELTPFTAHLNSLLSDANNNFDFPSLPSLESSPNNTRNDFDFSHFDPQDFMSTVAPMPSSPPAWFGVYEDPVEQDNGLWSDYQLPSASPAADATEARKTPKTPGLAVDENGHATVAFSVKAD